MIKNQRTPANPRKRANTAIIIIIIIGILILPAFLFFSAARSLDAAQREISEI